MNNHIIELLNIETMKFIEMVEKCRKTRDKQGILMDKKGYSIYAKMRKI